MEWLNSLMGPYPVIPPAALVVPVLVGVLALLNSSEKERNRKGWHPVTKWLVIGFSILVIVSLGSLAF